MFVRYGKANVNMHLFSQLNEDEDGMHNEMNRSRFIEYHMEHFIISLFGNKVRSLFIEGGVISSISINNSEIDESGRLTIDLNNIKLSYISWNTRNKMILKRIYSNDIDISYNKGKITDETYLYTTIKYKDNCLVVDCLYNNYIYKQNKLIAIEHKRASRYTSSLTITNAINQYKRIA